jgi:hypothetical protein
MVSDSRGSQAQELNGSAGDDLDREMDDDLRAQVKGELEPGERLLWAGRSSPPLVPPGPRFYLGVTIALVLLAIGIISCAHAMGRPQALPDQGSMALGIFCCFVGSLFSLGLIAGLIGGRNALRHMARISYAVTDRRIIFWIPVPHSDNIRIFTMSGASIQNIVRVQRPDGSGDLEFSATVPLVSYQYYNGLGFKHIPEVRRVEQIIRNNLMNDMRRSHVERDHPEAVGDISW